MGGGSVSTSIMVLKYGEIAMVVISMIIFITLLYKVCRRGSCFKFVLEIIY
jgi:hypothetical protein